MRRHLLLVAGVAGFLIGAGQAAADPVPSAAPDTTQNPTTNATPASDTTDINRVICKSGPPPVGSRIGGSRVCHTQREWDLIQQEERHNLERLQIQRGNGPNG